MNYRACLSLWLIAAVLPGATAQTVFNDAVVGYAHISSVGDLQFDNLYHRTKGEVSVLNSSTGVYTVRFHRISTQGSVIPISSWAREGTCTIGGYGVGLTPAPNFGTFRWGRVHCFDDAGNPLNRWTNLALLDEGSSGGDNPFLAFADSRQATPPGNFLDLSAESSTYNPGGLTTTLTRLGTGQYNVDFNGLGAIMPAGSTVQVIPFSDTARSCRVDDWTLRFAGTDKARVRIHCYGRPGDGLVNTRFIVLLTSTPASGASAASAAVEIANQPSNWTTLRGSNLHNPHGQIQVRWNNSALGGIHQVRFEWPSDAPPGVAFATPTTSPLHACWSSSAFRDPGESGDYLYVNVGCRLPNGSNSSAAFNILMTQVTHEPPPDMIFSDRFE